MLEFAKSCGKGGIAMRIFSYNMMAFENRCEVESTLRELLLCGHDFIFCAQEVGPSMNFEIPECEGMHVTSQMKQGAVHRPNLVTISSGIEIKDVNRIFFPRISSMLWKTLFQVFYKSEVPQHGALVTNYNLPNKEKLLVVNAHFDVLGGVRLKTQQALKIKEVLEKIKPHKVIIVGDFNLTSLEKVQKLCSILGDEFRVVGNPSVVTSSIRYSMSKELFGRQIYPLLKFLHLTGMFDTRRDWIITKNVEVLDEGVLTEHKGSDHYPVWYEIE